MVSFKPHKITPPSGRQIGFVCDCGLKFPTQKAADQHMAEVGEQMEDQVIKETKSKEVPKVAAEPKSEVAARPAASNGQNAVVKIESLDMMKNMILKYVTEFSNNSAAKHFLAQVNLMMRNNPRLADCTPQSIFVAAMACAHLDLPPNTPEQYAYIIPYGREAQFQLGYRGLAELAYRSGVVKAINAELVFAEDTFERELGTERRLRHIPPLKDEKPRSYDRCLFVYATAKLNNGETVFEILTKADVDKIRKTSKAGENGPWKDWPEQMAKKTAVKRLLKLLPSSNVDNRFKRAAEWDSQIEGGKALRVDAQSGDILEGEVVELGQSTIDALNGAQSREEIQAILQDLPVAERKAAAGIANERVKALA